jgi:hypothetical protein
MKNLIYIIILASVIVFVTACADFLEEDPKGQITIKNFYQTESDAVAATDAIYFYLISGYNAAGLWDENYGGLFYNDYWELPELMSDNAVTKQTSVEYIAISNFDIDGYSTRVRCLWRDFYQTINVCNTVIQRVPNTSMDEVKCNQLIAEARFVRGMCYFELTRFFGDVPLHTEPTTSIETANIPRTPAAEIYPVILDDLVFAENNLKYSERLGFGRPYALSASALLARVYLTLGIKQDNEEYLGKAVEKADLVIPAFPLEPEFADIFKLANRFKGERIWEINFNASLSQGWYGNQFLVRLLPKMDVEKGGPRNAQGFDAATEDMYSAFEIAPKLDKRRNVTLFRTFTYPVDGSVATFNAPYFCKYWDSVAEPNGNESNATYPYLRTAEMYLIKAEALNELNNGPTVPAVTALNTIRARAGLDGTTATTYNDFKKAILAERRCEFAIEGHRWHDLVRMCVFQEISELVVTTKPQATPTPANMLFPVPFREIDASNKMLTQNEGYY